MSKGWELYENSEKRAQYIIPKDDEISHFPENCPCNPTATNLETGWTRWVHNSLDRREIREREEASKKLN